MQAVKLAPFLVLIFGLFSMSQINPLETPTKTLGAFASGQKTSTALECRWSPQGSYLVCDQLVNMWEIEA